MNTREPRSDEKTTWQYRASLSVRALSLITILMATAAGVANAQTQVITDTSRPQWGPSPDDGATFGTPPVPVVSGYRLDLWLKANVAGGVTTGPAALRLDMGKPAVVAGAQTGPFLKPLVQPNIEYVAFPVAVGPGGEARGTAASVPFGFPSAPRGVATAVSFTP